MGCMGELGRRQRAEGRRQKARAGVRIGSWLVAVGAAVLFLSLVTSGTGPEAKRVWLGCWGFFGVISLVFWHFERVDWGLAEV